jgi:predicted Zn finger-like uncharacterized protein
MLLTTCSNCGAQFKVLPEHLNVRQGRVMCGRCRHVFNAFESLKRVEDEPPPFAATLPLSAITPAAPAMTPYAASSATMAAATPASASMHSGELDIEFVSEPEFSQASATMPAAAQTAFAPQEEPPLELPAAFRAQEPDQPHELASALDQLGPLHATEPPSETPQPLKPDTATADADLSRAAIASIGPLVDALTQSARVVTPNTAPAPSPSLAPAPDPAPAATRVEPVMNFSTLTGASIAPPATSPLVITDPPVAETFQAPPEAAGAKKWIALACLAALVLLALFAFQFRNSIVQSYPQLRPAFTAVCGAIGCKLSWGRDINAIVVTGAELVEAPGKPGKLIASATLANRGAVKQDLPAVELRLTNNTNQVVISRILEPAEYLGRAVTAEDGIAANSDLAINLNIEIPPNTNASGYEFLPFYR